MPVVAWVILAIVVVGAIVAFFGWDRYRGSRKSGSADIDTQPTDEVFVDPESGKRMRVWYNAATGQREYRAE